MSEWPNPLTSSGCKSVDCLSIRMIYCLESKPRSSAARSAWYSCTSLSERLHIHTNGLHHSTAHSAAAESRSQPCPDDTCPRSCAMISESRPRSHGRFLNPDPMKERKRPDRHGGPEKADIPVDVPLRPAEPSSTVSPPSVRTVPKRTPLPRTTEDTAALASRKPSVSAPDGRASATAAAPSVTSCTGRLQCPNGNRQQRKNRCRNGRAQQKSPVPCKEALPAQRSPVTGPQHGQANLHFDDIR